MSLDRLMQHVQALGAERATAGARARARDYLTQVLTDLGWQPQLHRFGKGGVNLVAERPGTASGTILVSAHYDTVPNSPGADDNASGVAAALEVARLLRAPTARSLRLVFFDQEELGLLGSLAYTAEPAHLKDLHAVVNLEMMGYACYEAGCQRYPAGLPIVPPTDRGDFLGVIVDQEHVDLLSAFTGAAVTGTAVTGTAATGAGEAALPPLLTLPVPLKGLLTPDLLRSDHAPFWAQNIGAVMVADTANFRNPHYHQPTDTPDTLDRRFLTGSAQVVVNAIADLLDRPLGTGAAQGAAE